MKKVGKQENIQQEKKSYTTPILNKYGLIRDLTTGGSGSMSEGSDVMNSNKMP